MAQPLEPIPGVMAEHSALNSCSFNPNWRKRQPRNLFSLCFHAFSHHAPHYPLTMTKNTITNNNAILLRNVIKMYKIRVSQYTHRLKEVSFLWTSTFQQPHQLLLLHPTYKARPRSSFLGGESEQFGCTPLIPLAHETKIPARRDYDAYNNGSFASLIYSFRIKELMKDFLPVFSNHTFHF